MYNSVIAPIVAVLALAVQLVFDVKIPDEVINDIVVVTGNVALVVVTLIGIFTNHKK